MKYGKVLSYQDAEKAKGLIGKKIACSDNYYMINETPDDCTLGIFQKLSDAKFFPFITMDNADWIFIREVIEDEHEESKYILQ